MNYGLKRQMAKHNAKGVRASQPNRQAKKKIPGSGPPRPPRPPRPARGKSRRGGRSRGAGRSGRPSARVSSAPTSLQFGAKEDPFLRPQPRQLVPVPLHFSSVKEWSQILAHNVLAEFWCVVREGAQGPHLRVSPTDTGLLVTNGPPEGLMHHLLQIGRSLHLVVSQQLQDGAWRISVKPKISAMVSSVRSFGYVGSFMAEVEALGELASSEPGPVLQSLLQPRVDQPGDYVQRPISPQVPLDPSQAAAVHSLKFALEKIQGPPGTGKSTTIFHIITSRLPAHVRILVTCSRNVAVESLAQKLEQCASAQLLVFGNESRIGNTAKKYLMSAKCDRDERVLRCLGMGQWMEIGEQELRRIIQLKEAQVKRRRWQRVWRAYLRRKYRVMYALQMWMQRIASLSAIQVLALKEEAVSTILHSARVVLCTIASSKRLLMEADQPLMVHTVIVDESGCTAESSVALLLKLKPVNLILVGDHRQLRPTSMAPDADLQATGHDRSLLERAILASGSCHRLGIQYRMHPAVCRLVSSLFYNSLLTTGEHVAKDRLQKATMEPLVWYQIASHEGLAPNSKSYCNTAEVRGVQQVLTNLRKDHPDATIACLTLYKGQMNELGNALPASLGVELLTVDACQGSEFDYVVLSTVRSNSKRLIGFAKDKHRICVALSRCLQALVIVGDLNTMSSDPVWKEVGRACKVVYKWAESVLPASGSFVSISEAAASAPPPPMAESKAIGGGGRRQPTESSHGGAPQASAYGNRRPPPDRFSHSDSGGGGRREHSAAGERRMGDRGDSRAASRDSASGNSSRFAQGCRSCQQGRCRRHAQQEEVYIPPAPSLGATNFPSLPSFLPARVACPAVPVWPAKQQPVQEIYGGVCEETLYEMFPNKGLVFDVLRSVDNDAQRAFVILLELSMSDDQEENREDDFDVERDGRFEGSDLLSFASDVDLDCDPLFSRTNEQEVAEDGELEEDGEEGDDGEGDTTSTHGDDEFELIEDSKHTDEKQLEDEKQLRGCGHKPVVDRNLLFSRSTTGDRVQEKQDIDQRREPVKRIAPAISMWANSAAFPQSSSASFSSASSSSASSSSTSASSSSTSASSYASSSSYASPSSSASSPSSSASSSSAAVEDGPLSMHFSTTSDTLGTQTHAEQPHLTLREQRKALRKLRMNPS